MAVTAQIHRLNSGVKLQASGFAFFCLILLWRSRISFLKRVFFLMRNQGSRMDRRGLWVDLRKGIKMVADRIVPWRGKRSTIVKQNKIITKVGNLYGFIC